MDHGYLKPNMPVLVKAGLGSTILLPSKSSEIDITPLDMNGKIHPDTMASEFGAYKIIGRSVSVKRFLYENSSARIFVKGNHSIVISKWSFDKYAPSQEVQLARQGITIGKTLGKSLLTNSQGGMVGGGMVVKAGITTGKMIYDGITDLSKSINMNKPMSNPDKDTFDQFKNGLKQIYDNMSGNRIAVLISVLAMPPKIAKSYDTKMQSVTFSNIGSVLKGL